MDKCKLSLIIPVYNAEGWLDRCLRSVIAQEFASCEIILVDDGSSDSSPLICDRYSSTDPRFRTVHKTNGGVSSARNAGLNIAKGEYVMFLDSDDELLPLALESMTESLDGTDFVMGGYTVFIDGLPDREVMPDKGRQYRGGEMTRFFEDNIRKNCEMLDAPWAKMFRRRAIGNLRFCEDLSYAEDKLFVFSFLMTCTSANVCPSPVYAYHLRSGSLGSDIVSDRHLMQMRRFLPAYAKVLSSLTERYPASAKLRSLYRKDVVGRYCCRIMNIFMMRRTALLTDDYLSWLYSMMDADNGLGVFSIRMGQVFNMILYKLGNVRVSVALYRFMAGIVSLFKKSR